MPAAWRLVVLLYNLFLIVISTGVVALALGYSEPLQWLGRALATSHDRLITGAVAGFFALLGVYLLAASLKPDKPRVMVVRDGPLGEVCMTVPAVKQIILKAARTVEGLRDIKPVVNYTRTGVGVFLHVMINPDYNVPEMMETLQTRVGKYLEDVGGLKVEEIKVLVDDIAAQGPRVR